MQLNGSDEDAKEEDRREPGEPERMVDSPEDQAREEMESDEVPPVPEVHPEARRP